jgi:hypothetical protein
MRNATYGYFESNPLPAGHHENYSRATTRQVPWTAKGLVITRLRLLTDPGFPLYDVSYCHGMIGEEHVIVQLPFSQLVKRKWKSEIIAYAKRDGVYAKGLGIFDNSSILC